MPPRYVVLRNWKLFSLRHPLPLTGGGRNGFVLIATAVYPGKTSRVGLAGRTVHSAHTLASSTFLVPDVKTGAKANGRGKRPCAPSIVDHHFHPSSHLLTPQKRHVRGWYYSFSLPGSSYLGETVALKLLMITSEIFHTIVFGCFSFLKWGQCYSRGIFSPETEDSSHWFFFPPVVSRMIGF